MNTFIFIILKIKNTRFCYLKKIKFFITSMNLNLRCITDNQLLILVDDKNQDFLFKYFNIPSIIKKPNQFKFLKKIDETKVYYLNYSKNSFLDKVYEKIIKVKNLVTIGIYCSVGPKISRLSKLLSSFELNYYNGIADIPSDSSDSDDEVLLQLSDNESDDKEFVDDDEENVIDWEDMSLEEYTQDIILNDSSYEEWEDFFEVCLEAFYLKNIDKTLKNELKNGKCISPPLEDIYNAFLWTPLSKIKVIIIGQDPYATPGVAMGIAFGHHKEKLQPSLRNIYNSIEEDGYIPERSGDLRKWCDQGVFLINTALTVRVGKSGSHSSIYTGGKFKGLWAEFITHLFSYLDTIKDHLVVIMWGSKAQHYSSLFDDRKHYLLKAPHPAASCYDSSNTGFLKCHHFSKCNSKLVEWGYPQINWR